VKATSALPVTYYICKKMIYLIPCNMKNDMDSFLTYMPFISVAIVAGLFIMALVNFSTLRKSMQTK
jgi:high-affinity Fe2+/Pb2+ permease